MIWKYLAAWFVRVIVSWCTARGRYVDYIHQGKPYMRRYVITGYRTGDPEPGPWRARFPNLYLHHIQAPDSDLALHDHPWPWGLALILLGGYREERLVVPPVNVEQTEQARLVWLRFFKRWGSYEPGDVVARVLKAGQLNVLRGDSFHRIADLKEGAGHGPGARGPLKVLYRPNDGTHKGPGVGCSGSCTGTWTLFLAGPRKNRKGWGYIVEGRGYVPQETRHAELGATEARAPKSGAGC